MKKVCEIIKNNPLFNGINCSDFDQMFSCIDARTQKFQKGDIILLSGNSVNFVGLVLSGSVQIIKEDLNGNSTIVAEITISEIFAETFACAGISHSPVTVIATEDSEILLINYKKIITTCASNCVFHTRLIENMLKLIAKKNIMLNQKNEILSKRTTKEKLLLYFETQRGMVKKFTIPYNREELAHYLCVDRSAMSNELCKMRDDGLITFNKNEFELL